MSRELRAVGERLTTDVAAELEQRLLLDDVVFDACVHHEAGARPIRASTHVTHETLHPVWML